MDTTNELKNKSKILSNIAKCRVRRHNPRISFRLWV